MANPKSWGRMIRKDISRSKSFASLSQVSRVLFCMLIPHFSGHGKMNGHPAFIKGEICPLLDEYDLKTIERCLAEISEKTNVKWFKSNDLLYLQALNWTEHQELNPNRLGHDSIPDYNSCNSLAEVLQKSVTKPNNKPKPNDNDKPNIYAQNFNEIWELYPKRNGHTRGNKHHALKAFETVNPEDYEKLKIAIFNYKKETDKKFIKDFCRFIPIWQDYLEKEKDKSDPQNLTFEEIQEIHRKEGFNVV